MIEIQIIISIIVISVEMWEQVLLQVFVKELEDQSDTKSRKAQRFSKLLL